MLPALRFYVAKQVEIRNETYLESLLVNVAKDEWDYNKKEAGFQVSHLSSLSSPNEQIRGQESIRGSKGRKSKSRIGLIKKREVTKTWKLVEGNFPNFSSTPFSSLLIPSGVSDRTHLSPRTVSFYYFINLPKTRPVRLHLHRDP